MPALVGVDVRKMNLAQAVARFARHQRILQVAVMMCEQGLWVHGLDPETMDAASIVTGLGADMVGHRTPIRAAFQTVHEGRGATTLGVRMTHATVGQEAQCLVRTHGQVEPLAVAQAFMRQFGVVARAHSVNAQDPETERFCSMVLLKVDLHSVDVLRAAVRRAAGLYVQGSRLALLA